MTWKELSTKMENMSYEQLQTDVTALLLNADEVIPVCDLVTDWNEENESDRDAFGLNQVDGVLDEGHPYMTISF